MMTKKTLISLGQLLAAVPAGAIATLSFAPYDYAFIAPLTLILFFLLLQKQPPKRSALIGFFYGLGMFGTGISWVHVSIDTFGGMPKIASMFLMCLLISYLALYPALFGYLFNRFNRQRPFHQLLLSGPVIWLVLDWIRGWLFTGFPWLWMGYSQLNTPLAHFAPIFGVEGITLALMLISGSITATLYYRNWRPFMVAVLVVILAVLAGIPQWVKPDPKHSVSVALIQGNISQEEKWLPSHRWPTLMKYMDLTRDNWGADLIIWPEAAIPALEEDIPTFLQNLDSAARANNSTVITGILDQKLDGEFNLPMSSFSRGAYIQPNIQAHGYSIAPALCYEIAFGEQIRQNVTKKTELLLTLSNDAWFGHSIGPFQHMEIAQMRALELGKPLLRGTNTGITAVVDHNGHITKELPQFVTGVLKDKVIPTIGMTPYTTLGSWPLYGYCLWALALSWLLVRRKRGHFRDVRLTEKE
jgi:apolipoprotein N-acyltransferase